MNWNIRYLNMKHKPKEKICQECGTPAESEDKMAHRVYELTDEAKKQGMNWDEAIYNGEIQTVEEFETLDEALEAYENEYCDPDLYGVE